MIDWNRVSELRQEVGEDGFEEVVDMFLEEVEQEIETLSDNSAGLQMESRLHFLKGSALNLGFSDFAQLCQRGEASARNGRAGSVDAKAIEACYHASRAQFSAMLLRFAAA